MLINEHFLKLFQNQNQFLDEAKDLFSEIQSKSMGERKRKRNDEVCEIRSIFIESAKMYTPVCEFLGFLYEDEGESGKAFLLYEEYLNCFFI